jgi:hypothetical protein
MIMRLKMSESTIYVSHGDEHIKILQNKPNDILYIRSIFGDEVLVSSEDFCDLLEFLFDRKAFYQLKRMENRSDLDESNMRSLEERMKKFLRY